MKFTLKLYEYQLFYIMNVKPKESASQKKSIIFKLASERASS